MNTRAILILVLSVIAAAQSHAAPALGPSISSGANPTERRPIQPSVPNDPRLAQRSLYYAPINLKNMGTHKSLNSETPVQRHRGPVGSLTVTVDIQARPAF